MRSDSPNAKRVYVEDWYDDAYDMCNGFLNTMSEMHPENVGEGPSPDCAKVAAHTPRGEVFTYTVLNEGEIRVLQINEMNDQDADCILKTVSLKAYASRYYALSYCWSDELPSRTIRLQGFDFCVTESLYAAMYAVYRHSSKEAPGICPVIWIDALCIDQKTTEEKSSQVEMMSKIYRNAAEVLLWLGPEEDDSDILMDILNWLEWWTLRYHVLKRTSKNEITAKWDHNLASCIAHFMRRQHYIDEQGCATFLLPKPDSTTAVYVAALGLALLGASPDYAPENQRNVRQALASGPGFPGDHPLWGILCAFNNRSWFWRVWTYQEVKLARTATILCGSKSAGWSNLKGFVRDLSDCPVRVEPEDLERKREEFGNMHRQPLYIRPFENSNDLVWLLMRIGEREASEPRDYVYSILGLLHDDIRRQIVVDYKQPVAEVYKQATKIVCQDKAELGFGGWFILLRHFQGYHGTQIANLPSWCPDFSGRSRVRALTGPEDKFIIEGHIIGSIGMDSFGSALMGNESHRLRFEGDRMLVPGIVVDTVESTLPINSFHLAESHTQLLNQRSEDVTYDMSNAKWLIENANHYCWSTTAKGRICCSMMPLQRGERICWILSDNYLSVLSQDRDIYRATVFVFGLTDDIIYTLIKNSGGMTTLYLE